MNQIDREKWLGYCERCEKRDSCTELCSEVLEYVEQDHVTQKEKTIGVPIYQDYDWPDLVDNIKLTDREKKIVTLFGFGLSRADVCQVIGIKRHALREALNRLRKKLKKT